MTRTVSRITAVATAASVWLVRPSPAFAHESVRPAGGTPVEDLVPAAIVGTLVVAAVIVFGWLHRSGRTTLLTKAAGLAERALGLPGYAALPVALTGGALLVAVFGFYWDVSSHIDNGRDPGPFANPSHWLIIFGLLGIALAGALSFILGVDEEHPTAVRIRGSWRVPVGGALLGICGVIALLGFPLDDAWHRIFGQDVTLWSPTHIQMVGGASLSTLCLWILIDEGRRSPRAAQLREPFPRLVDAMIAGAFLIGASTLQAEFDFAVPQFRLLYQPVLLMVAAGIALVPARIRLGRWGALKAMTMFLVIRGVLTLLVTPVAGRTLLHFPLYLAAAVAVELAARVVDTDRQLTFGAVAGLGIATLGLAGEWLWSHLWMPIPWPTSMLGETLLVAMPAAVGAAIVGGFIGRALAPSDQPRQVVGRWVAIAAGVVVVVALVYPIPMADLPGATVDMTLEEVTGGQERTVAATLKFSPVEVAEGATYINVTTWQGAKWRKGVNSFVDPLERVGPGVYRTTQPIPVFGEWKALVRLHNGRVMTAAPIFLPADPGIPAPEVPAEAHVTRDLQLGQKVLLRESKEAPGWLTLVAYIITLGIIVIWVGGIGLGIRHLRRRSTAPGSARSNGLRSPAPATG
jgi:hypothetical protein